MAVFLDEHSGNEQHHGERYQDDLPFQAALLMMVMALMLMMVLMSMMMVLMFMMMFACAAAVVLVLMFMVMMMIVCHNFAFSFCFSGAKLRWFFIREKRLSEKYVIFATELHLLYFLRSALISA